MCRGAYGRLVVKDEDDAGDVVDVTIPLQCLVKDSKLILQDASKVRNYLSGGNWTITLSRLDSFKCLINRISPFVYYFT